ncbi:hypothetical protein TKK_0018905 [Trichogramma kaykai]
MGNYIVDPKFNDPLFGPICASFLFQLSFATTSTTIVSGAMAERYGTKIMQLQGLLPVLVSQREQAVGLEGGAGWPSTAAVTTVLASMGGGLVGLGFSLNNPKGIDILSQINGILGAFGALVAVTGFQRKSNIKKRATFGSALFPSSSEAKRAWPRVRAKKAAVRYPFCPAS